MQAKKPQQQTN